MPRKKNDDGTNPPKRTRKKKEVVSTPTVDSMKMEPGGPLGPGNMMSFDSISMGPAGAGQVGMHLQHNGGVMPMGIGDDPQQMNHLGGGIPNGGMIPFQEFNFYQQPHPGNVASHPSQQQGMPSGHGSYGAMPSQTQQMSSMPQQAPSSQSHFNESEAPPSSIPIGGSLYQPTMGPGGPSSQNGPSNRQPGPGHPLLGQIPLSSITTNHPQPPYLEYRIQEMNRRIYSFQSSKLNLTGPEHARWWDAFSFEFFDDDAKMTIAYYDTTDNVNRKYMIGRTLIPRFYRTIFDNGVSELYYLVRSHSHERISPQQWGPSALDCDDVLIITRLEIPSGSIEVRTECRLFVEFAPYDENLGYRIRHWAMEVGESQESFPHANGQDYVKSNITQIGLPHAALHFLKLCLILEPMQKIMQQTKLNSSSPRDTLKMIVFYQYQQQQQHMHNLAQHNLAQQHINAAGLNQLPLSVPTTPNVEDTTNKKQPKKRQRKSAAASTTSNTTNSSPSKKKAIVNQPTNQIIPAGNGNGGSLGRNQCSSSPPQQQQNMGAGNFQPNHVLLNSMVCQDMLVVNEPSLMGCEYGGEDLRDIARLKNPNAFENNNTTATTVNGVSSGDLIAPQSVPTSSTIVTLQQQPPQSSSTPTSIFIPSSQQILMPNSAVSSSSSQQQNTSLQHLQMMQQGGLEPSSMILTDYEAHQVGQMVTTSAWMGTSSTTAILTTATNPSGT